MKQFTPVLVALLAGFSECKIGKGCISNLQCSSNELFLNTDVPLVCVDGVCQCNPKYEPVYNRYTVTPECNKMHFDYRLLSSRCNETSCPPNEECTKSDFEKQVWSILHKESCYCKEGYLRVGRSCLLASYQNVTERCYVDDSVIYACNAKEKSTCISGKCGCYDNFYANKTTGKCESMKNYVKKHNLTEYRGKPNEYCKEAKQCIEGLRCNNFKCTCPHPCFYNETAEVCDCGVEDPPQVDPPILPAITGIFLGLIISGCWYRQIRKTIDKLTKKRNARLEAVPAIEDSSPNTGSYALSPVRTVTTEEPMPSVGPSRPAAGDDGRQSPLPPKHDGEAKSPICPPSPSMYGINPAQTPLLSDPVRPTASSVMDLPPPYSLDPPSMDYASPSAPLLFPSSQTDPSGSLPYPVSPSMNPHLSSPSPLPYSPSPTSYPLNPPTAPSAPYPSSSVPPATALPKQESEKDDLPPPYSPSCP